MASPGASALVHPSVRRALPLLRPPAPSPSPVPAPSTNIPTPTDSSSSTYLPGEDHRPGDAELLQGRGGKVRRLGPQLVDLHPRGGHRTGPSGDAEHPPPPEANSPGSPAIGGGGTGERAPP